MKIEKLSGNILKVTITKSDFATRNIDSLHLKITSKAYRNFIHDIVSHAENELGFVVHNGNLMVETRPGNKVGDFVVIVKDAGSKIPQGGVPEGALTDMLTRGMSPEEFADMVEKTRPDVNGEDPDYYEEEDEEEQPCEDANHGRQRKAGNMPRSQGRNDMPDDLNAAIPDFSAFLKNLQELKEADEPKQAELNPKDLKRAGTPADTLYDSFDIVCFEDFENLLSFATAAGKKHKASSMLYSFKDVYYVVFRISKSTYEAVNVLESIAIEFGGYFLPSELVLPILEENGKLMIRRAALKTLAEKFG